MIIEFIGLPGSGKSSIAKELENLLKAKKISLSSEARSVLSYSSSSNGIHKKRQLSLLLTLLSYCIRGIRIFVLSLVQSFCEFNLWAVKRYYKITRIASFIDYWYNSKQSAGKLLILDQAILQCIWSFSNGIHNRSCSWALRSYVKPYHRTVGALIVVVEVPIPVAIRRIRMRSQSTCIFRELPDVALKNALQRGSSHIIDQIIPIIASLNRDVIILDGQRPINENARYIYERIKSTQVSVQMSLSC